MPIKKKKISELTLADSMVGLYTIGVKMVNGVQTSVKVSLEFIKKAYDDVVAATKKANDAATAADTSRKQIEANESTRQTNETARVKAETNRSSAETERIKTETARSSAETEREKSETARIKAETGRTSAENARVDVEKKRVSAETSRSDAEKNRVTTEATRVTAEEARIKAETTRSSSETGRVDAEKKRVSAESSRATSETGRVSAETGRVTEFGTIKKNAETATSNANNQADRAKAQADNPPKMGENGNWWQWDDKAKKYVDTGVLAKGGVIYPTFAIEDDMRLYMSFEDEVSPQLIKFDEVTGELFLNVG